MKNVKTIALATALAATAAMSAPTFAADRGEDIHAGDYSWMQFNYMYAFDELPGEGSHDYLEMEFGGRAGIVDLYGYVDVFNPSERPDSDKSGSPKMFMKFNPRFSIDAMTGMDLSAGPIQEVYISTLFNWGGGDANLYGQGAGDVNNASIGIGADVMVPWFGKVSVNLYKYYEIQAKAWNGYQFSMNWFKPFINFDNGSFISYQGYLDYQFASDDDFSDSQASAGGVMFNGLYWHSENFALGYGLKSFKDVYLIKDSDGFKSSGFSHYVSATYKF
ncbi:outer membrane protein OmpK [Shewanella abyssi]|uniref:nucleoside-specific channel-forming Tsx family protein n=1 Tax=Shewanella abyssi TaxID=311789 RepID=UPI00200D9162|nr:outer membrane protein OmpK [Shewanella abyssi]MCL1050958.1 outer membrane protein OmpK [Shewanella abyssi]